MFVKKKQIIFKKTQNASFQNSKFKLKSYFQSDTISEISPKIILFIILSSASRQMDTTGDKKTPITKKNTQS